MKQHERTSKVRIAANEIKRTLLETQDKKELTDIEMLQILNEFIAGTLKYMLRDERHGDRDKEADLEYSTNKQRK